MARPPARGRGRPASPEREVGRLALIEATIELYRRMPPAKVTRFAVARHAGADPALINYHFGSWHALQLAVAQQLISERRRVAAGAEAAAHSVEDKLAGRWRGFFKTAHAYPLLHQLMLDEIAPAETEEGRDLFRTANRSGLSRLSSLIDQGVSTERLKKFDPLFYYLAEIALSQFFFAARPIVMSVLGEEADLDALAADYEQFVAELLLNGITRR
jgi:AcrR family transcriptional regulator